MENIRQLIENSMMSKGLKVNPHFDRVLNLLQSMGDQEIDQKFLSENPAIQALRGGAMAAQKVTDGTGVVGDGLQKGEVGISRTQGADLKGQGGLSNGEYKSSESGTTSRTQTSGFSSRLSAQVAKQIADKMIYQTRNGTHQLRLNLTPAHLGRVTINMVVRDNTVHATVVTENPAVKEALEEHMSQLKSTLAQQGVELERFDVGYNGRERNTGQSGQNRRRFSGSGQGNADEESGDESATETADNTGSQRLVNRLI
jgi:flagellar hook-length control protein FliK